MAVTSVRSNSMPTGGPTATQSVQPIGTMTPADIAALTDSLTPVTMRFRQQSTIEKAVLNQHVYTQQGAQDIKQISSVGLGLRLIAHHHMAISLVNASTAAQAVSIGSYFPFNLIANTQISLNGGATVYSASGAGGLPVWLRTRRGGFQLVNQGGYGPALNPGIVLVNVGAGGTATNANAARVPAQLSGIASISVAGDSTSIITVDFVTEEWFVLDRESMLGALPLQNNSTYATVQRTLAASFLGANDSFPFWVSGGVPGTLTIGTVSGYTNTEYEYASVPSDPALYAAIVSNSYQVQEQPGVQGVTGVGGLTYNIPQNQYLVALHRILRDEAYTPVGFAEGPVGGQVVGFTTYMAAASASNKRIIQYNGGAVIPVLQFPMRYRGDKFAQYGADLIQLPGYLLWDGEDTANGLLATDNMGWIDCYNVASPQSVEDIGASVDGPVVATFVRESVVAGSVSVVGG